MESCSSWLYVRGSAREVRINPDAAAERRTAWYFVPVPDPEAVGRTQGFVFAERTCSPDDAIGVGELHRLGPDQPGSPSLSKTQPLGRLSPRGYVVVNFPWCEASTCALFDVV